MGGPAVVDADVDLRFFQSGTALRLHVSLDRALGRGRLDDHLRLHGRLRYHLHAGLQVAAMMGRANCTRRTGIPS